MPDEWGDVRMRKQEQRLWDTMRKNAPPGLHLERVENAVGDGTPDVHYMKKGSLGWIELKAPKRPAKETTRLLGDEGLRISQENWLGVATFFEIPAYVLIRDDHKNLYLIPCKYWETMNDMTAQELEAVSLGSTWKEIFGALK
jgi:hypothetical protein